MAFFSRKGKNNDGGGGPAEPAPNVLIDLLLAQSDVLSPGVGDEIKAANRRTVEDISSGQLADLPAHFHDWFIANRDTAASPTGFGYTWYAHQDTGRMQLVMTQLLEITEMNLRENQPGVQLWGSGAMQTLVEQQPVAPSQTQRTMGIPPKPIEPDATAESTERRARSIARLQSEGVRVYDDLPVIESEANTTRRTAQEIAERAMALCLVSFKGDGIQQGVEPERIDSTMVELRQLLPVEHALSPQEKSFLDSPDTSMAGRFTWRYEALWVLLWALGYVEALDAPIDMCDVDRTSNEILNRGAEGFISQAAVRPQSEILDECDLIYRYSWACVDSRINGNPLGSLNPGVVVERHWALNWLIGYQGQSWDTISTDT